MIILLFELNTFYRRNPVNKSKLFRRTIWFKVINAFIRELENYTPTILY